MEILEEINPSYLSETICGELIEIVAHEVHVLIMDEALSSGYFNSSVDSPSDPTHIDQ